MDDNKKTDTGHKANEVRYYIVNAKTGGVYGKSGGFSGVPIPYKTFNAAETNAQMLANYYNIQVRVDDQDGNEICRRMPERKRGTL